MRQQDKVSLAVSIVALLMSVIGAVTQFSTLLDTKRIGGFIERVIGDGEYTKIALVIFSSVMTGVAVKAGLDYKARSHKKLIDEEAKKLHGTE